MFDYLCPTFNHGEPRCRTSLHMHCTSDKCLGHGENKGRRAGQSPLWSETSKEITTRPLGTTSQDKGGVSLNTEPCPTSATVLGNARIITSHAS